MSLQIVKLDEKHLEDAAEMVATSYQSLRAQVRHLPARYEETAVLLPMIRDLAGQVPGMAAIKGGRLAGFLVAMVLPSFRGRRSVYSPEWANGADVEDSRRIYQEMYAHLSAQWVADRCLTHLITLLAHDREAIDAWHWLGFGLAGIDGVRDLAPVRGSATQVDIRRARVEDVAAVMALDEALRRHLASAPTFLPFEEGRGRIAHERWLADPANAVWLAFQGAQAVGSMTVGPANEDACTIILDENTASIVGAFTEKAARGLGIGTALLNRSLDWAYSAGYERCAVDFESQNILAARFWPRYFQPVCYSLIRHVDEYAIEVHETQEDRAFQESASRRTHR
jgi:GNAT superfamily N-acetyltransferase